MDTSFGESASSDHQNPTCSGSSGVSDAAGNFECSICLESAQDPIVTLCGHLFCWPCLYEWLHLHAHSPHCPICNAAVEEAKLIPLYGRGRTPAYPQSKSIPRRPTGQRPATGPEANPQGNPWVMGGAPVAISMEGLSPVLSFEVHELPYGPTAGFPYGYEYDHPFHGGYGQGVLQQALHRRQGDVYLEVALFLVGYLVVGTFLAIR